MVLTIVFSGVQFLIYMMENNTAMMIRNTEYIIINMIQLYIYCWAGEKLIGGFDRITGAIYTSKWSTLDAKLSRYLVFAMMRSNRAVQLQIGRMFDMDLFTFVSILKRMASFITILRIMIVE